MILETDAGAVAPGRWTRIQVRYDRETFALLVDGVLVESADQTSFVDRVDGPLVLTDFTTTAVAPPAPAISMQTCGS